jgi:DoxX.
MAAKNSNIWNAFLRIYIGLFFLYAAHFKLNPAFFAGLHNKLAYYANHDPLWFYGIFLSRVAVPNAFLFAILIVMGELFAGIFLTAGFITRIAAFVAIFLNLNYLFAMYWISPVGIRRKPDVYSMRISYYIYGFGKNVGHRCVVLAGI